MMLPGGIFFPFPSLSCVHVWTKRMSHPAVGVTTYVSYCLSTGDSDVRACTCVCVGRSAATCFSLSLSAVAPTLHPISLKRSSFANATESTRSAALENGERSKRSGGGASKVVPLLRLVVHVDKDGRVGYGSHGGAAVVRRVRGDQVWAQVGPKDS